MHDLGIDCSCPFNIPAHTVDGSYSFDLPDINPIFQYVKCPLFFFPSGMGISASGDFDAKIIVNNASNQHVACFRFFFTMMK
jgi:hypothetical protein